MLKRDAMSNVGREVLGKGEDKAGGLVFEITQEARDGAILHTLWAVPPRV